MHADEQGSWSDVYGVPALSDNYIWLVPTGVKSCVIFDPGESVPVIEALLSKGWTPDAIVLTHRHSDHIAGVNELRSKFKIRVYAPFSTTSNCIVDEQLDAGSWGFEFGSLSIHSLSTPGHTDDHTSYILRKGESEVPALMAGDALFSLGCGRLLEGSAEDLLNTLGRIRDLPSETQIFAAHEYSQKNAAFAEQYVSNEQFAERVLKIKWAIGEGVPTYPVSLATELETNPFLLAFGSEFCASLPGAPPSTLAALSYLRGKRDIF
jgi:hydroxyacylglutathione hydrolase